MHQISACRSSRIPLLLTPRYGGTYSYELDAASSPPVRKKL